MKPCDLVIESGRVVQILPSFIRSLCRARFEYDADELLEEQQARAAGQIEASPIFARYKFPLKHAAALRSWSLEEIKEITNKQVMRQQMKQSCPYLRDPKKRSCWSCPVAKGAVLEMIEDEQKREVQPE